MSYIFEALAEVRLTTENIQKVIKMYPRDNDWKKLITKHRRDIDGLRRGKDLPKKVEDELMQWALKNGEIRSDDVDELDDFKLIEPVENSLLVLDEVHFCDSDEISELFNKVVDTLFGKYNVSVDLHNHNKEII